MSKIRDVIHIITYSAFCILLLVVTFLNINNILAIILLFFIFLSNYTLRSYFFNLLNLGYRLKITSFCIDLILLILIVRLDSSMVAICLYLFLLGDIILSLKRAGTIVLSLAAYICLDIMLYGYFNTDLSKYITALLICAPIYLVVALVFVLIKSLTHQNAELNAALEEITVKKIESENLYAELKEAYQKVEESTAVSERSRIAREIHDTVGHTLTTVLVELEATKRLMKSDTDRAGEKLELAQGQVRKGLNDIRKSVRLLEKNDELLDFNKSIDALISDFELNSGVSVKSQIDTSLVIADASKKVLYSSLQEGLTNGIRHGKSTAFLLKLEKADDKIQFSLEDNGSGATVVQPGFGLRAMRDRVEKIGGIFHIDSTEGEGFAIKIKLPLI